MPEAYLSVLIFKRKEGDAVDEEQHNLAKKLMGRIELRNMPPAEAQAAADKIASLKGHGVIVEDIFPVGTIVHDGIGVSGHLPETKSSEIVPLMKIEGMKEIRLFPKGIVLQDGFQIDVILRRRS